jgi:hypothetical protein
VVVAAGAAVVVVVGGVVVVVVVVVLVVVVVVVVVVVLVVVVVGATTSKPVESHDQNSNRWQATIAWLPAPASAGIWIVTEMAPSGPGRAPPRSRHRSWSQQSRTSCSGEKPSPRIPTVDPGGPEDGSAARVAARAGGAVNICTARTATVMSANLTAAAPRSVIAIDARLPWGRCR